MLCFVFLNTVISKSAGPFAGLAIGFVILAGGYSVGHVSGACLNPAVAIGISLPSFQNAWCLAYTVFELTGCALGALLFRLVRPGDFQDGADKKSDGDAAQAEEGGSSAAPADEESKEEEAAPEPAPLSAKLISECLGTFLVTLTLGLCATGRVAAMPLAVGAAVLSLMYALFTVSGGHFNPAVTLAVFCCGREKLRTWRLELMRACSALAPSLLLSCTPLS